MKKTQKTALIVLLLLAIFLFVGVVSGVKVVEVSDNGGFASTTPRCYYYNNRIYVAYGRLDRTENNPNGDIDTFIRYYDFETDTVSPEYLVGLGHGDDHGYPTLCVDDRGYIHVFYGSHCNVQKYARSEQPEDITSWVDMTHVIPTSSGYTYPRALFVDSSI